MGNFPITVMLKPASGQCNMRCAYCFYCDEMANRRQRSYGIMSESTLENVIKKTLWETGSECTIAFQGGEPTLAGLDFFKKAVAFQKMYNSRGVRVHNALQTNGWSMTPEWAEFFARHDFLIGVSVDGTREIHDAYRRDTRGGGTYDRALAATRLLDRYGVSYNILTVVHAGTAPAIRPIYRDYRRHGWKWLQFIPCLDPLAGGQSGEWSLTPAAYGRFLCELFDLWYADCLQQRQPYIRSFENYVGMLAGYPPESCDMRGICGPQYVVEADGSVYPCDFYMLDEYRLGNLNTENYLRLDKRRREIGFVDRSRPVPDACRECPYFSLCRNGCRRQRDESGRTLFCESYRAFFAHALPRLRALAPAR